MKSLFLVLAFVCLASPAFARSLPNINIESSCKDVADMAGGSAQIELQCRKMETAAKKRLETMKASNSAWNSCMDVGEMGDSFQIFEQCIKMEMEAEAELGR